MKTLVLYTSYTGNTEKVTEKIVETLKNKGIEPRVVKVKGSEDIELYDYELVFLGSPVIEFLPSKHMMDFLKKQLKKHRSRGDIVPKSPKLPGKFAVCYVTFSGPHTGIREAVPAIKYMEQFFEHIRFTVLGEWYVVGEFKGKKELSTNGVLGDIRGRPSRKDLESIALKTERVLELVQNPPKVSSSFKPGALKIMERYPEPLEKLREFQEEQKKTSSLDERTEALIKAVAAGIMRCEDCFRFLAFEALKSGVTDIELKDAVISCALIGGSTFLSFANSILEELGV